MGEIVDFVSKSELERLRLIREARAIYDSIFPPNDAVGERSDEPAANCDPTGLEAPARSKRERRMTGAHSPSIATIPSSTAALMPAGHCVHSANGGSFKLQAPEEERLLGEKMMSARAFARRCGAYLALAVLTLQLALSFAHVHKHDLAVLRIDRSELVSVAHAQAGLQVAERPPARLADDDDRCPICFSGFLLSNSSLPHAPPNPAWLQFAGIDRVFNPVSESVVQPRRAAFLSRAPPVV